MALGQTGASGVLSQPPVVSVTLTPGSAGGPAQPAAAGGPAQPPAAAASSVNGRDWKKCCTWDKALRIAAVVAGVLIALAGVLTLVAIAFKVTVPVISALLAKYVPATLSKVAAIALATGTTAAGAGLVTVAILAKKPVLLPVNPPPASPRSSVVGGTGVPPSVGSSSGGN